MSTLTRLIGDHRMAVIAITEGRFAGRYSVAFDFFGAWQFLADDDTGELRTWKTEYEAYHIGEASRQTLDQMLTLVVSRATPRTRAAR
ncbi:MAG TPA: hypothetical protein VF818_06285 [Ktedonobacterales bacterium]